MNKAIICAFILVALSPAIAADPKHRRTDALSDGEDEYDDYPAAGTPDQAPPATPAACIPPALMDPQPMALPSPAIPAMAEGEKPNFIVIITDDQGWDDIGLHNPEYIHTPNINRFIRQGVMFDNFYVTPQCAQTRASLLTGRNFPRTGTMLVHGGYDFINSGEATAGQVMSDGGYRTAHFGKWHNSDVLGYEPWNVGFEESFGAPGMKGPMRHNGQYIDADGTGEEGLLNALLSFVKNQTDSNPFFAFYALNSIHYVREPRHGQRVRFYPARYKEKYEADSKYQGIEEELLDVWAMLEYLDNVLGRLFDFIDNSPLAKNTYIMLMSDNGPSVSPRDKSRDLRMPSRMQGVKHSISEGGIRNFLTVRGPGVQPGVIDSTLLDITDILPTLADLAGTDPTQKASNHMPWDGISFKNLLQTPPSTSVDSDGTAVAGDAVAAPLVPTIRGSSMATQQQLDRFVFKLSPHCWDANAVPVLGPDREVLRPQPLLDYDVGGMTSSVYGKGLPGLKASNPGFQACTAVRWKEYKWIGLTGKLYRLTNGSHIELSCNEVPEAEAAPISAVMSAAARSWWGSIVAEPHSFTKPTFYLGLGNWSVTNVLAAGAHERTPGSITLFQNAAGGFKNAGDRMCFKLEVLTAGTYDVVLIYVSNVAAVMRLSVGPYAGIVNGSVPSITANIPPERDVMRGRIFGSLALPASGPVNTEACLELVESSAPGRAVFVALANLRFTRRTAEYGSVGIAAGPAISTDVGSFGKRIQWRLNNNSRLRTSAPTAGSGAGAGAGQNSAQPGVDWDTLRKEAGWPEGQAVLESMWSPFNAEGIDDCVACKPNV